MPRALIKNITMDESTDSIMSSAGAEVGYIARLEKRFVTTAIELSELRRFIFTAEGNTNKKLTEMAGKIGSQTDIVMQQQLFLENIDRLIYF